jgi:hypothetical protein
MATTCGAIRLRSARLRLRACWPRPNLASGLTSISRAMARRLRPSLQARPRRHSFQAEGLPLPFRPLARLAQNQERGCTCGEARGGRGLGQAKIGRPKVKGGPRLGSVDKGWCCHERGPMTANHVEHEIATFPGSPGGGSRQRRR